MNTDHIHTIDDIIKALDEIILLSEQHNDTLGYFAALYRKVTKQVREGIQSGFFEDGPRMEKLDVVFAKRYLDAYYAYAKGVPTTASWNKAFELSTQYWPIVLQHLLMGMNAHISLDLGIAAAEISKGQQLEDLHEDFNKINEILSSLINEVQRELAMIWPTLYKILKITKKADNLLVDFSMQLARDGAWKFASAIFGQPTESQKILIQERDQKVANKTKIITQPGWITKIILLLIRIGERGTVREKIKLLKKY